MEHEHPARRSCRLGRIDNPNRILLYIHPKFSLVCYYYLLYNHTISAAIFPPSAQHHPVCIKICLDCPVGKVRSDVRCIYSRLPSSGPHTIMLTMPCRNDTFKESTMTPAFGIGSAAIGAPGAKTWLGGLYHLAGWFVSNALVLNRPSEYDFIRFPRGRSRRRDKGCHQADQEVCRV